MTTRRLLSIALLVVLALTSLRAADPSGRWTATFATEVGEQQYSYEFVVKGTTLTGTAKGNLTGESQIAEGKIDGDKITFVENSSFMEMPLRFVYSGTMTSADEIAFTRTLMDFAPEKLVAKRVK
jgi:hypothetical protein